VKSSREQAACAQAEAAALSRLAASALRDHGDLPALLEEIRQMFGLAAVSLLERQDNGTPEPGWFIIASAGDPAPERPGADVDVPVSDMITLAGCGRVLSPPDKQVLFACTAPLVGALPPHREAHHAGAGSGATGARSAPGLLAAASQKARSLLATADEALAEAADPGLALTADERAARCQTARRTLSRLGRLLADIGDLTRLHAGALETYLRPVDLDEVVASALDDLGPGGGHINVLLPEDLPDVITDAAVLSRVVTSLAADALHRSQPGSSPVLTAAIRPRQVEIRIIDHQAEADGNGGPESVMLRLSRDLAEAIGHTVRFEQIPGGGRSVVITVPAARRLPAPREAAA
jgi:two-component system sensor histidine kinase KdpD